MKTSSEQIKQTHIEVQNLISSGMELISENEYKNKLLNFGLKLCEDKRNYLILYYNTLNDQHFLQASTSALDETKQSCFNVYGSFYKKYMENEGFKKEFKEFRNKYFTLYKGKYILSI